MDSKVRVFLNRQSFVTICFFSLQNIDQFENDGCENCEEFLHMKNDRDKVFVCTSNNFDGFVTSQLKL